MFLLISHIALGFGSLALLAITTKTSKKQHLQASFYSFIATLASGAALLLTGSSVTRVCISGLIFTAIFLGFYSTVKSRVSARI